jgi:hypothetical protein
VQGDRSWLDRWRYDIDAIAASPISEVRGFDPQSLRVALSTFIADHFGAEIYVNGQCQHPCGRSRR